MGVLPGDRAARRLSGPVLRLHCLAEGVRQRARYEIPGVSLYLGDLRLVDAEGREVPYALRAAPANRHA